MKKIIKLLICFVVSFICYSLIISAEEVPEVPEVPKVPGTDDDNETIDDNGSHETIITLPKKYSNEEEEGKVTITLNPDDTFKIEMIDLEGVIIATVQGTYKTIEENIVELYAPTKDELFDTIELFEDTKTWDFYYSENIPIVDEPLEEQPNLDENGEIIEDEEGYVKSFLSEFFEENIVSAIMRIILNIGIDIGTVIAVIAFMRRISDKYNSARTTLETSNTDSKEQLEESKKQTKTIENFMKNEVPKIIDSIQENKHEIVEVINQGKDLYEKIKTSTEETIEKSLEKVEEFKNNINTRTEMLEKGLDILVEILKVAYANNTTLVEKGQAETIANMVNEYEKNKKN